MFGRHTASGESSKENLSGRCAFHSKLESIGATFEPAAAAAKSGEDKVDCG